MVGLTIIQFQWTSPS